MHFLRNIKRDTEIGLISRNSLLQSQPRHMRLGATARPALLDRRVDTASMTSYAFKYTSPCGIFSSRFHAVELVVRVEKLP